MTDINECSGCLKLFKSIKSLNFHTNICIYNMYKKNNSNINISNDLLNDITKLINALNLNILNNTSKIYKSKLLNHIKILYKLNNKDYYYIYIYNLINEYDVIEFNYIDLIYIISTLYHINYTDIIKIINSNKECFNNFNKY